MTATAFRILIKATLRFHTMNKDTVYIFTRQQYSSSVQDLQISEVSRMFVQTSLKSIYTSKYTNKWGHK